MTEAQFRMRVARDRLFAESAFIYKGRESELEVHWQIYYCADVSDCDVKFGRVRSIVHSERETLPGRRVLNSIRSRALIMKIVHSNCNKFNMKFDISIISRHNHSSRILSFKNCISRSRGEIDFDIRKEDKFVIIDNSYISSSFELEIVFAMSEVHPQIPNQGVGQSVENNYLLHQHFVDQLKMMYEDKKYTDFSVVVGDDRFDVHKSVLAARSPVFNAMLERGFSESAQNRIVISDFEADAVEKFLEFIYTDDCDVEEYPAELLACAEKYDVEALKSKCEDYLAGRLNSENAVKILQMADLQRADSLKEAALKFVRENLKVLMLTPEWRSMTNEMLNEILASILENPVSP